MQRYEKNSNLALFLSYASQILPHSWSFFPDWNEVRGRFSQDGQKRQSTENSGS